MRPILLIDLDDTLFDHAGATRDALVEVRASTPAFQVWSLDRFDAEHRVVLERLHLEVLAGKWTIEAARVERFSQLLRLAAGDRPSPAEQELERISWAYRGGYERAWRLVDGAIPLLTEARAQGRRIAIVTNNAVKEQQLKLERGGLAPLVDELVASEALGISKPDPRIITHALGRLNATADRAAMLGDSLITDIAAARAAGVHAVWLNRWQATAPAEAGALQEITSLTPARAVFAALDYGAV